MIKSRCLNTATRLILKSLLILVSYVEISHSQTDVYCVDPHTGLHYPVNSTWPSSTFCGTYTCNARPISKPEASSELTSEPFLQENKIHKDASQAYELLKSKLKNENTQDPTEKKDNDADAHIKLSKAKDFLSLYEAVNKLANFIEEKSDKQDNIKIKTKDGKNSIQNISLKETNNNDNSDRIMKIKDLYVVANQMADALEKKLLNEKNTEFKVNTIHLNNLLNIYQEIANLARKEILDTESSGRYKSQSIKSTLDSFYSDYYKYLQHYYTLYPNALMNDKEKSLTQNPVPISDLEISATDQDEIYYYVDDISGKIQQVAIPKQTQNINVPDKILYSDKNFNYWNVNGFQFPPNQVVTRNSGSGVNQNSVPPSGYPNGESIYRQSQDNSNTQQMNNDLTSQLQSSILFSNLESSVQQPQSANNQSSQNQTITSTVPIKTVFQTNNAQQLNIDPMNQAVIGIYSNLLNSLQQPQSPNNQINITATSPQSNYPVVANNTVSNYGNLQSYNPYYENYYKNYTQQYAQNYTTNNLGQYKVPQAYSDIQAQNPIVNTSNSSPNTSSNYPVQATNNDYQNYYNSLNLPQNTPNQFSAPQVSIDNDSPPAQSQVPNPYYPQSTAAQPTAYDYQNYYNNYLNQYTQNQNVAPPTDPNGVVQQNPSPDSYYPANASSPSPVNTSPGRDNYETTTSNYLLDYYDYYITYPVNNPNKSTTETDPKPIKGVSYYGYDPQQGKYVLKTPKDTEEYYEFLREYLDVMSDFHRRNNTNNQSGYAAVDSQNSASEVQHTFYKFDKSIDYSHSEHNTKIEKEPDIILRLNPETKSGDSIGFEHMFNPSKPDFPTLKRISRQINPFICMSDKSETPKEFETYITVNGCPETLEPGYFRAGDTEEHFPKCCPQKID